MLKFLSKNWAFASIVVIFIFSFSLFVYVGTNKLYKKEVDLSHEMANTQLISATSTVEYFFSDIRDKLNFLKQEPLIQKFVDSRFKDTLDNDRIRALLNRLIYHSGNIQQAYIMDTKGNEILHSDKSAIIEKSSHLHIDGSLFALNQVNLGTLYSFIPIGGNGKDDATMLAVVSLWDSLKQHQGFLILNMDMTLLYKMLPENISFKLSKGNTISIINRPESIKENIISHTGRNNILLKKLSPSETLHYTFIQTADSQFLTLQKKHRHLLLSKRFNTLFAQAMIAIGIFLGFVGFLSISTFLRIKEKIRANKTMMHALISLTDWRDPETGNHLIRTQNYCAVIAKKLKENSKEIKISKQFIESIYNAAPLHDIGKVGIKDSILLKPGKFTSEEFEIMKQHVTIGALIIRDLIKRLEGENPTLEMALNICEFHHEKFDGTGYPKGLKGEQIPIEAKIFAIADVYDALRSVRPYKKEIPHDKAVEIISSESGKHFDPEIVIIFLECQERFKMISTRQGEFVPLNLPSQGDYDESALDKQSVG